MRDWVYLSSFYNDANLTCIDVILMVMYDIWYFIKSTNVKVTHLKKALKLLVHQHYLINRLMSMALIFIRSCAFTQEKVTQFLLRFLGVKVIEQNISLCVQYSNMLSGCFLWMNQIFHQVPKQFWANEGIKLVPSNTFYVLITVKPNQNPVVCVDTIVRWIMYAARYGHILMSSVHDTETYFILVSAAFSYRTKEYIWPAI